MNSVKQCAVSGLQLIFLFGGVACSEPPSPSQPPDPSPRANSAEGPGAEAVRSYIEKTYGWPKDVYRVEQKESKEGRLVFWAVHRDDETTGTNKSLAVYVDPATQQVVKVMHFQ